MKDVVAVVEGISKYFGKIVALDNVSFEIEKGEILGYLGPNGAGKTTTIRILSGLLHPDRGSVRVFGINPFLDKEESKMVRGRTAVALENPGHFMYATAYRNLMYYAKIHKIENPEGKIQTMLKQVGLWERRNDRVETFSKGMMQRLTIARCLLHDPDLLIFDEPTSGLDPTSQKMVRDFLLRLVKGGGKTIFLSSHNLYEVQQICSRICILNRGKLMICDEIENLRKRYAKPVVEIKLANGVNETSKQKLCEKIQNLEFVLSCDNHEGKIKLQLKDLSLTPKITDFLVSQAMPVQEIKSRVLSLEELYEFLVGK